MKKFLVFFPCLILMALLIPFVCPFISCSSNNQDIVKSESEYKIYQTISKTRDFESNTETFELIFYDFQITTTIYHHGDMIDINGVSVKKNQIDSVKCAEYKKAKETIKVLTDFYNKKCE